MIVDVRSSIPPINANLLQVFECEGPKLRNLSVGSGGEIQLADAINIQAQKNAVEIVNLNGRRFDCGTVAGHLEAQNYEYQQRLKALL